MKPGMVFIGLGFELAVLIPSGLYLGQKVDEQMGWPGFATAGIAFAVLIAWVVHLSYLLKRFSTETEDKKE